MASAAEMLRRLQSVNKITVLREMVNKQILNHEEELRLLKERAFLKGDIWGNGSRADYAPYEDSFGEDYGEMKFRKNPRAMGNVDLILSGDFINSFKLNKPKQNKYLFGATDSKRNKLVEKYGIDIMSLNQDTFNEFQIEVIKDPFIEDLRKIINKK